MNIYEKLNLDQKLMKLKEEVVIMQKNADGHGYKYVTEDSILLALNDKMIELGVKLTPRFVKGTLHSEIVNYQNAKGQPKTDILVRSEMEFVWKDIETKEEEIVNWGLLGQQADGSQALGSGLTYSNRYFLLKYFNIATSNDDPDKIRADLDAEAERKKMSNTQTKVKKLYAEALTILGTKKKLYEKIGFSHEEFLAQYNDETKCKSLEEQLTLIINTEKESDK